MSAKSKILISVGSLISVIVLIISSISFLSFKSSSLENYTYSLETRSNLISRAVEQYMERYFDLLTLTANELPINAQGTPELEIMMPMLSRLNTQLATINAYVGTENGDTFAASHKGIVPNFNAKQKKREWYTRGFAGEEKMMTTPYISGTGKLVMAVAVPVRRAGKVVAVLAINLRIDQVKTFIESLSDKKQVIVSRNDGFIMASGTEDHIGENLFELLPSYRQFSGESSSKHSYTDNGVEYFVVSKQIPGLNWSVWSWEEWDNIKTASADNAVNMIAIALILIIIALGVVYLLVMRLVYRPIGGEPTEIEAVIKDISQGNLIRKRDTADQTSGIYAAILTMEVSLAKVITSIHDTSQQLADSASSMLKESDSVNKSSKEQMEHLESATVTMSQMTLSAEEVSSNAQNAALSADSAQQSTESGITSVSDLNTNIQGLSVSLENVKNVIVQLETESVNIGSILDSIRGIAEQTNLLALNASIEAARAGDSGRGFAVVADEVRNLATRTQNSTDDIQKMIDLLQSASQDAVKLMHTNVQDIESAGEKSQKANTQLEAIGQEVKNIENVNSLIAAAACEQAAVAADINGNIQAIHKLATDTHQHSESTKESAQLLTDVSASLKNTVTVFKIS